MPCVDRWALTRTWLHQFQVWAYLGVHGHSARLQLLPPPTMARRKTKTARSVQCGGCKHLFTVIGYQNHIRQTAKVECQAEYQKQLTTQNSPHLSGGSDDRMSVDSDGDSITPPPPTITDYFGDNFGPDDFPGLDDDVYDDEPLALDAEQDPDEFAGMPILVDSDSDDEDEDEGKGKGEGKGEGEDDEDPETEYHGGHQWEPEPPVVPDIQPATPEPPSMAEENFTTGRHNIETSIRQPITVTKYPDPSAGAPIDAPTQRSNSFDQYGSQIPHSNNNPYAPFANKRNWEIARWAKLRGPGSNSLAELLGVEGVCSISTLSYLSNYFTLIL